MRKTLSRPTKTEVDAAVSEATYPLPTAQLQATGQTALNIIMKHHHQGPPTLYVAFGP